jgi:multiple sugar transport system ATP-binding protein
LDIGEGELLVLVGPSGCGKTTALRMIAGLEEISAGDLYIGGRRMNDVIEKDRDIAMVFQNYALYPHMTVAQNIAFSLKLARRPRKEIKRRVHETAQLLALEGLLDRRPKQLSGGQRQRVAMGRAIIREPQVFLMDEPLSNLDAKLRVQMRGEIEALQKRLGVTTVYVTHDQVEAMTMVDSVAVLRDGALQQVDTPFNIYDRPANLFVASFIGSPPMKLAQGKVQPAKDGLTVTLGDATIAVPPEIASRHRLDAWVGKKVIVGIRPEDIYGATRKSSALQAMMKVKIDRIESLGASVLGYFSLNAAGPRAESVSAIPAEEVLGEAPLTGFSGTSFCATFEPRTMLKANDSIDVALDLDRLHFFNPDTDAALMVEAAPKETKATTPKSKWWQRVGRGYFRSPARQCVSFSSGAYSSISLRSPFSPAKRTVTTPPGSMRVITPSPRVEWRTESPVARSGMSVRGVTALPAGGL